MRIQLSHLENFILNKVSNGVLRTRERRRWRVAGGAMTLPAPAVEKNVAARLQKFTTSRSEVSGTHLHRGLQLINHVEH